MISKARFDYDPATDSVTLKTEEGEVLNASKIIMVRPNVYYSEEKDAVVFTTDNTNFYVVRDNTLSSRVRSMVYAGTDGRSTPGRVYNFYFDTKDVFAYIASREGSVPGNLVQQIKLDENLFVYLEDVGKTWHGIQQEKATYLNQVYSDFAKEYVRQHGGTVAEAKSTLGYPLTHSDISAYARHKGISVEQATTVLGIRDPKQRELFLEYMNKGYDVDLISRDTGQYIYEQYKNKLLKGDVVNFETITDENKQIIGFRELSGDRFRYYLLADTSPNFRIQSLNVNTSSQDSSQTTVMKPVLYSNTLVSTSQQPRIIEKIDMNQLKAQVLVNYRELEANRTRIEDYRKYVESQINKALLASGMPPVAGMYFSGELESQYPALYSTIEKYATNLNFTRERYLEMLSSIDEYGKYAKEMQALPSGIAVKIAGIGSEDNQYYIFESEEKAHKYIDNITNTYEKQRKIADNYADLDKYYSQWYHPLILKSVREYPVEQYNLLSTKQISFDDTITLEYTDEYGMRRTVDLNLMHFTQLYQTYKGLEEVKPLPRVNYTQEEIDEKVRSYLTNIPLENLYGSEKVTVPIDEYRTIDVDARTYINERAKRFETLKLSDVTNVFGINEIGNLVGGVASYYVNMLETSGFKKELDKVTLGLRLPEITAVTTSMIRSVADTNINLGDLTLKEAKNVPLIAQLHDVLVEDKLLTIQQAAIKARDLEARGQRLEASVERLHAMGGVGVHTALDVSFLRGITSIGISFVKGAYILGVKTATTTLATQLKKNPITIVDKDSVKIITGGIDEVHKTAKIGVFTYTDDAVKTSVYLTEKVTTDDALRIVSNTLYTSARAVGDYATYPILTRAVINPVTNIVLGTEKAAKIASSLEKVERVVQGATLFYDLGVEDRFGKRNFLEKAYRYSTFQMRGDERAYFGGTLALGYVSMKGFEHQVGKLPAEKQAMAYLWSPVTFSALVVSNLQEQNYDIVRSVGYSIEEWKAMDIYGKIVTYTPKSGIGMYVHHREFYPSERRFDNYPVYHEYDQFALKTGRTYDRPLSGPRQYTLIGTTKMYSEPNYDQFIKENLKRLFGNRPVKQGTVTIEPSEKKATDAFKPAEISIKDKETVVKGTDALQKQITKQIEKTSEKTKEDTKELVLSKQKILKKEDVIKSVSIIKEQTRPKEETLTKTLEKQRIRERLKSSQRVRDVQKTVERQRVMTIDKERLNTVSKQRVAQLEKQRLASLELQKLLALEIPRTVTIDTQRIPVVEIPRTKTPIVPKIPRVDASNIRLQPPFLPFFGGGGPPRVNYNRLLTSTSKRLYKPSVGGIVLDIKTRVKDVMKGIGVRGRYEGK